jgi:EpsD family peptidyl-prolyl cis-trans isomerase
MTLKIVRNLAPLACVALVACHIPGLPGGSKAPSGQVVATVDGEEITLSELRAELAGAPNAPNAQAAKLMEEAALRQIIIRHIMAKAAHDQQLDKTPAFAIEKDRANQNLLTQALQRQIASTATAPSRADAENFVSAHPTMFAERKLLTVDQIRMARPKTEEDLKAFLPLKTLPEFETLLNQKNIQFQRTASVIDTASTDPGMVAQIEKLPAGEVFMVPANGMVLANQIRESRPAPFTGDVAVNYAMGVLRSQRTQEAVAKGVENLIKGKASTVKYNDAYKPTQPLIPNKPAAPAATTPAPAAPATPAAPAPAAKP